MVAFKQIYSGPEHLGIKDRIVYLLKPTEEWGPAGRPCCNLYPERYQNENMHSLMEGITAEVMPYDDTADTYIRAGASSSSTGVGSSASAAVGLGTQKEVMQL